CSASSASGTPRIQSFPAAGSMWLRTVSAATTLSRPLVVLGSATLTLTVLSRPSRRAWSLDISRYASISGRNSADESVWQSRTNSCLVRDMSGSRADLLHQAGAIPYAIVDGEVRVLLVTSRGSGRWLIPKGNIDPGLTPAEAAAKEAYEEGGIRGRIT